METSLKARYRRIFGLALPIIGGMVSQNVLNLVDVYMVSSFGSEALSAVGFGGFANFLAVAFVTGMSAGVQAVASRRKGEGRDGETAIPLNGGLLLVAAIAVPLSLLLIVLAPTFFAMLSSDPAVVAYGVPYLQCRLFSMIAVGSNFAFRGYWNGVDRSRLYLRTLLIMHASNVVISYVLIFGKWGFPALGVTGAGLGTAIATFIGTGYYFYLGFRHARPAGFLRRMPSRATLRSLLKLSAPSGLQSLLYAGGLTMLMTIVDRVGTDSTAAINVLMNITLVAFLPGLGLGLAAASLVGQALGRGDPDDAARWAWNVVGAAALLMFALGLPMAVAPGTLLAPFLQHEPRALALAEWPLRISGLTIAGEAMLMVLLQSLQGAGATRLALFVSIGMQWIVFLPIAYLIGPVLGYGLLGIWLARVAYRLLTACALAIVWRRRSWVSISV